MCACKCNVCECYSAVLVIRLTYTSTKTCIKNEWHDYGEYIYPLSISKLREGYALSKCFSFLVGLEDQPSCITRATASTIHMYTFTIIIVPVCTCRYLDGNNVTQLQYNVFSPLRNLQRL